MFLQLTPRLDAIKSLLPLCRTVADIGCDHGKLAVSLLQNAVCERVIAADVSLDSLQKAQKAARNAGLTEQMEIRCGDGLSVLADGDADAIVMAGMGGALIAELIEKNIERAKTASVLVLQPMQQASDLRRFLRCNGFRISDEVMVREGRWIYEIIRVIAGEQTTSLVLPDELLDEIGPVLWAKREPLIAERMEYKLTAYKRRLKEAQKSKTTNAQEGALGLLDRIEACERIIEEIRNSKSQE